MTVELALYIIRKEDQYGIYMHTHNIGNNESLIGAAFFAA